MRKKGLLTLLLLSILLLIPVLSVNAAQHYPDVTAPSAGNVFVPISGTFENVSKDAVLKRVNQIRLEAYQEGLTGAYVPIRWAKGLEKIAQVRAAEASVLQSHTRPSGKSIWEMQAFGASSRGENLAWGGSALLAIEMWYSEKDDYVYRTGGVTGHYTSMINPNNLYIGIGSFQRSGTWNCVCAEFDSKSGLDEGRTGISGKCDQLIEVPSGQAASYAKHKSSVITDLSKVKIKKAKAGKRSAVISWRKLSTKKLKSIKKIQIQYSVNKAFSKNVKTVSVSAKKVSKKIKGLKKGKRYYVRIRAYRAAGMKTHVSPWSGVKSFKAK